MEFAGARFIATPPPRQFHLTKQINRGQYKRYRPKRRLRRSGLQPDLSNQSLERSPRLPQLDPEIDLQISELLNQDERAALMGQIDDLTQRLRSEHEQRKDLES
jgi:hypothetical protein